MNLKGEGGEKNVTEALRLYETAAAQNDTAALNGEYGDRKLEDMTYRMHTIWPPISVALATCKDCSPCSSGKSCLIFLLFSLSLSTPMAVVFTVFSAFCIYFAETESLVLPFPQTTPRAESYLNMSC